MLKIVMVVAYFLFFETNGNLTSIDLNTADLSEQFFDKFLSRNMNGLKSVVYVVDRNARMEGQFPRRENLTTTIISADFTRSSKKFEELFFPNGRGNDFVFVIMETMCKGSWRLHAGWRKIHDLMIPIFVENIALILGEKSERKISVAYRDMMPYFHFDKSRFRFDGIEWNIVSTIAERNRLVLELKECSGDIRCQK